MDSGVRVVRKVHGGEVQCYETPLAGHKCVEGTFASVLAMIHKMQIQLRVLT